MSAAKGFELDKSATYNLKSTNASSEIMADNTMRNQASVNSIETTNDRTREERNQTRTSEIFEERKEEVDDNIF